MGIPLQLDEVAISVEDRDGLLAELTPR